jgi:uracil permease
MDWNRIWGKNTDATTEVMPEQTMGFLRTLWQACQHLLTAAGANILGPVLMGIDPSMALFTSGIGTLIYNRLVGVPAYMGTSFSYIATISLIMAEPWGGQSVVGGGIIVAGLVTVLVGLLIRLVGWRWIDILMPPVVLAMVVIAIGLLLAPVAFSEALSSPPLAILTFGLGVIFATKFSRGKVGALVSALPILLSIIVGYIVALIFGKVDLGPVAKAPFFVLPRLFVPVFDVRAAVPMALVTLTAVLMEHLGHLKGTGSIVGQDYIPRASRSLIADGISNALSWAGTPSVTYGENMGVFAITRVFSLRVMYVAGFLAVLAGFLGKLSPLILSIPASVLGGATFLLFGLIAWAGFNLFQTENINMSKKSNQVLVASMGTMMMAGILADWLRSNVVTPVSAADLVKAPESIVKVFGSVQTLVSGLHIFGFDMPALVSVALLGIILNLVLNWSEIVAEAHMPSATPAQPAKKAAA